MDYDGNSDVLDEKSDKDSINEVSRDDPNFEYNEMPSERKWLDHIANK